MRNAYLILIFLFLAGCSKLQSTPNETTSTVEEDAYKIAVIAPQCGPYEALGLSIVHGAELAVDLKNGSGGIDGKKIKLVKIDDGGLASEGTVKAKSLVSEMVLGVIGHLNSDISIPASEIYAGAKIPEISPGSTSPLLTKREKVKGYIFRTIGSDDKQGEFCAKYIVDKGFQKVAVLFNNRTYGSSLAGEFTSKLNTLSKNIEIVFHKSYRVKQGDFSKEVSDLKLAMPDVVFFVGEYGDGARFLKELRGADVNSTFLGSEGVYDEEFIKAGKGASDGALVVSLPEVKDKNFQEEYKKKFKKELGSYSANSFDGANILISAIEKIKEEDPGKIAKSVSETKNYSGITGNISFDENGDLIDPGFTLYEVKNGTFVAIR